MIEGVIKVCDVIATAKPCRMDLLLLSRDQVETKACAQQSLV